MILQLDLLCRHFTTRVKKTLLILCTMIVSQFLNYDQGNSHQNLSALNQIDKAIFKRGMQEYKNQGNPEIALNMR